MLREMVLAGMGISVMMLRSAQSDLAAGTMVELDVEIDPMYLQLRYAKNLRGNPPEIDSLVAMVRLSEGQTA
jgi:DNA-binding transcriptional LysR family regulator